jgi:hypothetical protein
VTLLAHELAHFYVICDTLNNVCKIIEEKENVNGQKAFRVNTIAQGKSKQKTARSLKNRYESEDEKQKRIGDMLIFCVKHHQFLLILHKKICELYRLIFGAHFLVMVIVLVTTLQTINSWGLTNTILTGVTGIMPLVVYCFGGEMIITAGADMSRALYFCGWQGINIKHARIILLMLCLSQQPLYYTAAGIFIMNRETFGDVAQVVYKIYAVFN